MFIKLQKWLDKATTVVAAILLAIMFCVITANVVLRLIPQVGGFSWYMEFSQYANVWAMMIGAAGIAVMGTNLRVEAVDGLLAKMPCGEKIGHIIINVSELVFYVMITYSGIMLSTRANQIVSTMPSFKMGQVYAIFPAAGVLCILCVLVNLVVELTKKEEEK